MAVSAPSDRRFRRAHVKPTGRRIWRWPWKRTAARVAGVALAVYAVYWCATAALVAGALTVTRITVKGTTRMSPGEVLSMLDPLRGLSMLTIDIEGLRQKLQESPWVADAAIRRVLPGTVVVEVTERQPLGIGRIGDQLYLLDQRGAVIDEFGPRYSDFDLPIIDGLAAPGREAAPMNDARVGLIVRLLAALQDHPDLAKRISQIDVSDARDAKVVFKDDTALVRIGDARFAERLQSYLDLAPTLRQRIPNIDYVDLRFDERVYVRPQAQAADPQAKT